MKAFVTGGAGFVGTHLVNRLVADGHEVTIFDQKISDWHSLTEQLDVARALSEASPDIVYHFAANADVRFGREHPMLDFDVNTRGTLNVLEAMRACNVKHIVFASTSAVYGDLDGCVTESGKFPTQTSLYGASKIAAEGFITAYCETFDMQATILRFAPMLGEGYVHGHVYDFVKKLRADPTKLEVLGDGKQRRYTVYVQDAIDAVILATTSWGPFVKIYNVGSDEFYTIADSARWIGDTMGLSPEIVYQGGFWPGEHRYLQLDSSRLKARGWRNTTSITTAMHRTVTWLQEHPEVFDR